MDNLDQILDTLNFEGLNKLVQFKRGNTQYCGDGAIKYKSFYCSKRALKKKKTDSSAAENEDSKSKIISYKDSQEHQIDCSSYYRFKATKDVYSICTSSEFHSHELEIKITQLSQEIIEDINNFPKSAKVCQVKEALDKKYATEIDYKAVLMIQTHLFNS